MRNEMLGKIIILIVTVPAEWLGTLVDLLEKLVSATGGDWMIQLKQFLRKEPCWVGEAVQKVKEVYTKLISPPEGLELDETDGKETIAQAKNVFLGWIDPDFKNWNMDVPSLATKRTKVTVHELTKDGNYAQIFGGISDDLNKLVMTQPQVIQFVQKHCKWLRTEGYGTLFLLKVGDESFVARVYWRSDEHLRVHVYRCSSGIVWGAEYRHRIVVPQLPLESSVP